MSKIETSCIKVSDGLFCQYCKSKNIIKNGFAKNKKQQYYCKTCWQSAKDHVQRKYSYRYDALNRMKDAIYQRPHNAVPVTNSYNESLTYDKNGNIVTLNRNGVYDDPVYEFEMDNLTYTYSTTNPNQLMKVSDSTNNPGGFKDGTNTDDDYSYDDNGNMLTDKNKGITQNIRYNHLNLPVTIDFGGNGNISYLYTATGKKLMKEVVQDGVGIRTDYLDGFQYINGNLEFFPTAEGYVKYTRIEGNEYYNYVYNYTDHLGNIRLSYGWDNNDNVLKILEENHYYPFGLKHDNYNLGRKEFDKYGIYPIVELEECVNCSYKIKYQGQERQDELGLNWDSFKWRNYDYAIGRFVCIDPLTEKYHTWTPYAFSGNRVVDSRELEGLEPVQVAKNTQMLVITVNGRAGGMYGDKIEGNKTLVSNLPAGYNKGDDGLSMIGQQGFDVNNAQVVNYAGSDDGITAEHIAQTIANYRETNPDGQIVLIGHSLGGKDVLDAANLVNSNDAIKNKTINLVMTMEAASTDNNGSAYSANLGSNVLNVVNFNSSESSMTGGGGQTSTGLSTNITLPSGTTHTNMDNTLTPYLAPILNYMGNGLNPVNLINNINFDKAKILNNGDLKPAAGGSTSY